MNFMVPPFSGRAGQGTADLESREEGRGNPGDGAPTLVDQHRDGKQRHSHCPGVVTQFEFWFFSCVTTCGTIRLKTFRKRFLPADKYPMGLSARIGGGVTPSVIMPRTGRKNIKFAFDSRLYQVIRPQIAVSPFPKDCPIAVIHEL